MAVRFFMAGGRERNQDNPILPITEVPRFFEAPLIRTMNNANNRPNAAPSTANASRAGRFGNTLSENEHIDAIDLLHPDRFDLLAKYIYAKHKPLGVACSWHRELYLDHIRVFNGLVENDGSGKLGEDGFIEAFDQLLVSISRDGFTSNTGCIPISRNGALLDGAHRAAACLLFNVRPACTRFDVIAPKYDYRWFQERGMPEDWLDAMATELCRIKENTFIALIYPRANGLDTELNALIDKYGSCWYSKKIQLKDLGPVNLIRQVYASEPWVGDWKDGFLGARNKASWCFQGDNPLRVFVIESNLSRMLELKKEVRELYNVENHSIHINDTHVETMQLAGLVLNNNSIDFMNRCNMTEHRWFQRLFSDYRIWLKDNAEDHDLYCIDGSAVLAAYGIRESRDIDFLHLDKNASTGFREIGSHNHESRHYQQSIENLITNPLKHFYYYEHKFLALKEIFEMKARRGEEKDKEDIALMENFEAHKRRRWQENIISTIRQLVSPRYIYRRMRFTALKMRYWTNVLWKVLK
jgi:hypothetical protein